MGADTQTIPARHGTATFVPAGSTIKIINTSGTQVIDAWAFALPSPPSRDDDARQDKGQPNGKHEISAPKTEQPKQEPKQESKQESDQSTPKPTPKRTKSKRVGIDLPSQEEAELATSQGMQVIEKTDNAATPKKRWSAYLPSVNLRGNKSEGEKKQVKENSRGWAQYFSAGQGITNYVPSKKAITEFANTHTRDTNKPYIQQLSDFSRTPVGAAGLSVLSGQGYASSLYAGYNAWASGNSDVPLSMEYLSMPHTRTATRRLIPKLGDVLVSNLREPMLTVLEDTSGVHDTLIAACDPQRYRQLGVDNWAEHGSCAENLVLALKELNERAGLNGVKGIGAEVTINAVPPPLNLFMNMPWNPQGELNFESSKAKKGDYVRFRAERDVVVVMSNCPHDVFETSPKPQDAHFIVEDELDPASEDIRKRLETASSPAKQKRPVPAKRAAKKLNTVGSAAAGKKSATAQAGPQPSTKHTPIGTTKTPKDATSSGPKASSSPSTAVGSTPASTPARAQEAPTPVRRDSASTVPSNTKHAAPPSTFDGSRRPSQTTTNTGGGGNANSGVGADDKRDAANSAPAPAPTERKKPRKIQKRSAEAA